MAILTFKRTSAELEELAEKNMPKMRKLGFWSLLTVANAGWTSHLLFTEATKPGALFWLFATLWALTMFVAYSMVRNLNSYYRLWGMTCFTTGGVTSLKELKVELDKADETDDETTEEVAK